MTKENVVDLYEINGKAYPIVGYEESDMLKESVPLVDIPMMSDETWDRLCLEDRVADPDKYRNIDDDVDATITKLKQRIRNYCLKNEAPCDV